MKKVAIGCAVVVGLLVLVLGIGGYYFYSKFMADFVELAEIPALNEQVDDQTTYTPPADARMTAQQVERYIGVQQFIRNELGARFRELEEKYEALSRSLDEDDREPSIRELFEAWGDVVSLVMDAKRAQVDALNDAGMSLSEYYWIRQQTLLALGYGSFAWNLEALAEDPSVMLSPPSPEEAAELEAAQHNRALLQEHEDTIEEWLALSFFGL